MSHPGPSNPKEKRKKQPTIDSTDLYPFAAQSTSIPPDPKRVRLADSPPPASTSAVLSHDSQTQAEENLATPVTTARNKSGKRKAAWSGIKSLLGSLESTTEAFGPLKSAISGLNKCVHIYEGASKGRQDYEELRTRLEDLLDDLTEHMASPIGPVMTNSVRRLCVDIETEIKNVEEKYGQNTGRRLANAMEISDDILECYRRVQGHLERLTLNANMTIIKAVNEQTKVAIEQTRVVNEQATEARLAKMCPAMSAIYNSAESDEIKRGSCTPGTRAPQIELLLEWAQNSDAGRTCWMNGMAGTGKTTIAYTVCSRLEEKYGLGASFFCSRVIPECRQVKNIIPSIAYQLARYSFPFRCALDAVLESDPDAHTRALKIQHQKLIVEPMSQVRASLPSDFIVVIDALDECENENSLGQVLDLLLSPVFALPVRFLVSSRPEPDIHRRMMRRIDGQDGARLVLHELDSDAVKSDIETYMRHELEHLPLTEAQWIALLERCGVLFIYASTTCRYLDQAYDVGTLDEAMVTITGPASVYIEDGDENAIDTLYRTILTTAFKSPGMNQLNRRRMQALIETVVCAAEPVTPVALVELLGLGNAKQASGLLQPLRSVLHVQETTGLVTTLHASFPDFLFSPDRSREFHCRQGTRHAMLSERCLRVIEGVEPKFNVCGLTSSHLLDNEVEDLESRVKHMISPGLAYACRYWSTHISLGEDNDGLVNLVHGFFFERLLVWMEVLNLTKRMRHGTNIVQEAEKWCSKNAVQSDVANLAHDAWQFVSVFANHPVCQSTPHIYVSMLPFWPASRPISRAYMPRTAGMIQPTGTAITQRRLALLATWDVASPQNGYYSMSISADGIRLAAATRDGIAVLDTITGESIHSLSEADKVLSVAIAPDGTSIIFGCSSGSIKRWDPRNGDQVTQLLPNQTSDSSIDFMTFSSDQGHVAIGLENGDIYIYSLQSKKHVHGPLKGHTHQVFSFAFSPDGSYLASGSHDNTVRIWDTTAGHMVGNALEGHTRWVSSVSFSPDGSRLASGSGDANVRVWDPQTGQTVLGPLIGHSLWVSSVAFSPDGRFIASSGDEIIIVWDAQTGQKVLGPLHGHTDYVYSVIFSPDNSRLFSFSCDNTIRVWNVQDLDGPDVSLPSSSLSSSITCVRYSHSGSHIAFGSANGDIHVWDVQTGNMVLGPLRGHTWIIRSVDYSPDDTYIASASYDRTLRIWDASDGSDIHGPITGHASRVQCIRFSPDSSVLASGSSDGTVRIWDVASGQQVMTLLEADNPIHSIGFSPNGRQLVSGSRNGTLRLLDRQTGEVVIGPLPSHSEEISSVEFSADGWQILSSSYDKPIHVWDIQAAQQTLIPHAHSLKRKIPQASASFSLDGRFIVYGCTNRTVQVWDSKTGRLILGPLEGHTDVVGCVQFSPDGSHVVSCSLDGVRFWDVSSCRENPHGSPGRNDGNADAPSHLMDNTPGAWLLYENGWVVYDQYCRLVWVPSDLQTHLLPHLNDCIVADKPWLQLKFDGALMGEGWTGCYRP